MTVEVEKTYSGDTTIRKFQIIGDSGMDCRPYLNEFQIGHRYLLTPSKINEKNQYDLFSCFSDFLEIDGDLVKGEFIQGIFEHSFDYVDKKLKEIK